MTKEYHCQDIINQVFHDSALGGPASIKIIGKLCHFLLYFTVILIRKYDQIILMIK